jgi:hypothetical protein
MRAAGDMPALSKAVHQAVDGRIEKLEISVCVFNAISLNVPLPNLEEIVVSDR